MESLNYWGKKAIGNITYKRKHAYYKLKSIRSQQPNTNNLEKIKEAEKELDKRLNLEEIWWSQKMKCVWLNEGDININIFILKQLKEKLHIKYPKSNMCWVVHMKK